MPAAGLLDCQWLSSINCARASPQAYYAPLCAESLRPGKPTIEHALNGVPIWQERARQEEMANESARAVAAKTMEHYALVARGLHRDDVTIYDQGHPDEWTGYPR